MIKVKICGITNKEDALLACALGTSALGFIFYKKSPRYVSPFKVQKIIQELPPFILPVGVFVNQKVGEMMDIADFCGIRTVQLHGDEEPEICRRMKKYQIIKAFRVKEGFDFNQPNEYRVSGYLFDTFKEDKFGGSGETFNWNSIKHKKFNRPMILAGGLTPQNLQQALGTIEPYAVDVSSGVEESPGKKDKAKLKEFFAEVNRMNSHNNQ